MKVILFGASGMVGQGVLLECLRDVRVTHVLSIGRAPLDRTVLIGAGLEEKAAKVSEIVHKDFSDYSSIESQLSGYDACFYCLGISSVGMSEKDYRHVTYDFTLAAAKVLVRLNPEMDFVYVSGAGTDSSEKGNVMWARVKGATENAVYHSDFNAAYMFRPGAIVPLDGIKPRNRWLAALLVVFGPVFALLKKIFKNSICTTQEIGKAMIRVSIEGAPTRVLNAKEIIHPEPVTSLEGPVELIDGKLVLRIPLEGGGKNFLPLTEKIAKSDGDYFLCEIKEWMAPKLKIREGSLVLVDNRNGKFTITRSAKNPVEG